MGPCVQSSMIYGSETWAVNAEQEVKLERAEMRMVRWMCVNPLVQVQHRL